jgi:hypothetical protein
MMLGCLLFAFFCTVFAYSATIFSCLLCITCSIVLLLLACQKSFTTCITCSILLLVCAVTLTHAFIFLLHLRRYDNKMSSSFFEEIRGENLFSHLLKWRQPRCSDLPLHYEPLCYDNKMLGMLHLMIALLLLTMGI